MCRRMVLSCGRDETITFKLFTYYINSDNGFAPCYANHILTLACCKPQIRRSIFNKWNDFQNKGIEVWIMGIRREKEHPHNAFPVYCARVDNIIKLEEYYRENGVFTNRIDCIYRNVRSLAYARKLSYDQVIESNPSVRRVSKGSDHQFGDVHSLVRDEDRDIFVKDIAGNCVLHSRCFIHFGSSFKHNAPSEIGEILSIYSGSSARTYHRFADRDKFRSFLQGLGFNTSDKIVPLDYQGGAAYTGVFDK